MSLRNDNIRMMNGGEVESQPSKPIRLLSLFSGIGAFEKALDRENIPYELANFCEIDKFAVKSYCAVHGVSEGKNLGDISKIASEDIPDCDLVTYGFPCQDVSVAGNQKGIVAGQTRSGLLYEALRIIEAKKPSYAICENVKNLVGKKFKPDFDKLLFMLDELGYNSYWQVLNAKDYGIPQNRERVFVISIRKDVDNGTFKFPEKFPLELRLKDMLEGDVDEKFYLTPKQVKCLNVNEPKGTDILHVGNTKSGGQKSDIISADGISSCLNATDYKQPKQIVDVGKEPKVVINDTLVPNVVGGVGEKDFGKQYRQGNRIYDTKCVSPALMANNGNASGGSLLILDQQIVDTPAFAQTDNVIIAPLNPSPDGTCRTIKAQYAKTSEANYKNTGSRGATGVMKIESAYESVTQVNENYAVMNGGKIGKMTDIYRRAYYEDGVSPTIHTCPGGNTEPKVILLDDTQGFDDTRVYKDYSPTLRAARSGLKVATDFRIRKLTPKECWRLMGFDDSDFEKAKSAGISNSQLYKQAGNSIVVNVLQYIFRNLFKGGVTNEA